MAHVLSGDWRSFVIQNGAPTNDQTFHLVINEANGVIQAGSTHGGAAVTGQAAPGASPTQHIKIDKAVPKKKYRGYLLVNGPQLMLVGVANLNPTDALTEAIKNKDDFSPDELAAFFDQQQEVWIATKP
ncbi:MAG TPA: hypothetical protein VLB46_18010 [Pyrinomonadaceae bacterium]|nr:hypothetical protein [Pyrinomonadaceae bacterium]